MSTDEERITVHFFSDSGMYGGWTQGPGTDGFGYDTTAEVPKALYDEYVRATSAVNDAEGAIDAWIDLHRPKETT